MDAPVPEVRVSNEHIQTNTVMCVIRDETMTPKSKSFTCSETSFHRGECGRHRGLTAARRRLCTQLSCVLYLGLIMLQLSTTTRMTWRAYLRHGGPVVHRQSVRHQTVTLNGVTVRFMCRGWRKDEVFVQCVFLIKRLIKASSLLTTTACIRLHRPRTD